MKIFIATIGAVLTAVILVNGTSIKTSEEGKMHPGAFKDPTRQDPVYESREHWHLHAQNALSSKLREKLIQRKAKNVIFFLGDGMSVPTVAAARVLKGQQVEPALQFGEEAELHFESFPHIGVSKTFCSDVQVADSACSATAYLCGTKAQEATMGVGPVVKRGDCTAQNNTNNHVSSILAWSQAAGKSTGIVTTARVTHASPGAAYAHIADRDWENDSNVLEDGGDPNTCPDIAKQLIFDSPGKDINVIMGGGRQKFLAVGEASDENDPDNGRRQDNLRLTQEWQTLHPQRSAYITGRDQLLGLDTSNTDNILGLFAYSHIAYLDRQQADNDPSLTEMTRVAIEVLSRNPEGFFLFVEGGRIDHAHHDGNAQRALWETIEFDKAIQKADEMTSPDDTLILVTADHAHVMSFAGYPVRGNPIMKTAGTAKDGIPYPTLSYANGPGYENHVYDPTEDKCVRHDPTQDDMEHIDYKQVTTAELDSETHGGDDVLIYSRGPFSHLLTGVQQQSYIPHVLAYASCVGDMSTFCDNDEPPSPASTSTIFSNFYIVLLLPFIILLGKL